MSLPRQKYDVLPSLSYEVGDFINLCTTYHHLLLLLFLCHDRTYVHAEGLEHYWSVGTLSLVRGSAQCISNPVACPPPLLLSHAHSTKHTNANHTCCPALSLENITIHVLLYFLAQTEGFEVIVS